VVAAGLSRLDWESSLLWSLLPCHGNAALLLLLLLLLLLPVLAASVMRP
jgi:hypothetical protein